MKNEKIVEVKNLKKQYGDNIILKDINLYINRGEVVSLIGPSGSGKSTILRCIVDLESITSGEILIEGNNLTDKNVDKKIKKEILLKTGMVFQTFNLFPHLSVRNNIVKTLKLVKKIDTSEGGGLGNAAVIDGYQRSKPEVMWQATIVIIVLVQIIQFVGNSIVKALMNKRKRT